MERVRSKYHALHVLRKARPKLRKAIVSYCDEELVKSICECVLNVLNGNVGLTDCAKRKLQKYKVVLRKVADKRVPLYSKKRLIVQKGGILLPLLTAVLPALASYIFRPRNDAA
jgi:hypothetical protein